MITQQLLDSALKLPPAERFELIDRIQDSLDRPDPEIDRIWLKEAEQRLAAYRAGQVPGIPMEDIFGDA